MDLPPPEPPAPEIDPLAQAVLDAVRRLDPDAMTPREALDALYDLSSRLVDRDSDV